MSILILEQVTQSLIDAGIPAQRGYPGAAMPAVAAPVAAVNLLSADMRSKTVTVKIRIFSPLSLGAAVCEQALLTAGEAINALGGKCTVSECTPEQTTGLMSGSLSAVFASQVPKITVSGTDLTHVLAFTSWRSVDENNPNWSDAKWNFRLEEYFPMGQEEEDLPVDTFTLTHTCENGTENYLNSTWTYQRRVWDASGIRQIRLGTASNMETG